MCVCAEMAAVVRLCQGTTPAAAILFKAEFLGTLYSSLTGFILNYGRSHLSPSSMNQAPTAASELLEVHSIFPVGIYQSFPMRRGKGIFGSRCIVKAHQVCN
nr:uncharacterized protein LOC127326764 [Lolium perenne]